MHIQLPELYFKPKLQTLEVLERTGIKMTHPRGLELLDGAGAKVDGDRVRIPAWLVEDAIRKAPSRVVLGKRNGERSVVLEGDKSWFGPSLDCLDYLDPLTDERMQFTSDHCRITASLADALPNFHWSMTIGMAADQPAEIADRVIARPSAPFMKWPCLFAGVKKISQKRQPSFNIPSPFHPWSIMTLRLKRCFSQ
jgi:trimethylamine--corrinoid protein Co-methyltransferase